MIKIKKGNDHIEIKGHSLYDEYGKDIVCASVSSIVITTINGILSISKEALKYKQDEGLIIIDIINHSEVTDALILNMMNLLKELENQYKENIRIEEV